MKFRFFESEKHPEQWERSAAFTRYARHPINWVRMVNEQSAAAQECAHAFAEVRALTAAGAEQAVLEHARQRHAAARDRLDAANRALQAASGGRAAQDADF